MEREEMEKVRTIEEMKQILEDLDGEYRSMLALKQRVENEIKECIKGDGRREEAEKNFGLLNSYLGEAVGHIEKMEELVEEAEATGKLSDKIVLFFNTNLSRFYECKKKHSDVIRKMNKVFLGK